MSSVALPIAYTAVLWWSTTGLILFLNRLSPRTFVLTLAAATIVMVFAVMELKSTADATTVNAAYAGFAATIAVWGWLEITFLMGFVTGPRKHACPAGCDGPAHFGHALQAIIYHELAIIACAVVIYAATKGAVNSVGLDTFLVLWAMRQSAKLNLFLGVPNLGEVYLPAHIRYLASLFRRRPMNLLFPLSITLGTLACAWFIRAAATDATAGETASDTMLATLAGLGLLEHWFMVLPLRSERLWRWSMRRAAGKSALRANTLAPALVRQTWNDRT